MKRLFKKLEAAMMAVAFAEAGEFDTARQLAKGGEQTLTPVPPAQDTCIETGTEGKLICS